jgi:hypothetical protein
LFIINGIDKLTCNRPALLSKRIPPEIPIMLSTYQMSTQVEEIMNSSMRRHESLSLTD